MYSYMLFWSLFFPYLLYVLCLGTFDIADKTFFQGTFQKNTKFFENKKEPLLWEM